MKTITSSQMSSQVSTRLLNYITGNRTAVVMTYDRAPTGVLVPAPRDNQDAENLMGEFRKALRGAVPVQERGLKGAVRDQLLEGQILGVTNTRGRWPKEPAVYLLPFLPARADELIEQFLELSNDDK